jgi:hypothetical protein
VGGGVKMSYKRFRLGGGNWKKKIDLRGVKHVKSKGIIKNIGKWHPDKHRKPMFMTQQGKSTFWS